MIGFIGLVGLTLVVIAAAIILDTWQGDDDWRGW